MLAPKLWSKASHRINVPVDVYPNEFDSALQSVNIPLAVPVKPNELFDAMQRVNVPEASEFTPAELAPKLLNPAVQSVNVPEAVDPPKKFTPNELDPARHRMLLEAFTAVPLRDHPNE